MLRFSLRCVGVFLPVPRQCGDSARGNELAPIWKSRSGSELYHATVSILPAQQVNWHFVFWNKTGLTLRKSCWNESSMSSHPLEFFPIRSGRFISQLPKYLLSV